MNKGRNPRGGYQKKTGYFTGETGEFAGPAFINKTRNGDTSAPIWDGTRTSTAPAWTWVTTTASHVQESEFLLKKGLVFPGCFSSFLSSLEAQNKS